MTRVNQARTFYRRIVTQPDDVLFSAKTGSAMRGMRSVFFRPFRAPVLRVFHPGFRFASPLATILRRFAA